MATIQVLLDQDSVYPLDLDSVLTMDSMVPLTIRLLTLSLILILIHSFIVQTGGLIVGIDLTEEMFGVAGIMAGVVGIVDLGSEDLTLTYTALQSSVISTYIEEK